MNLPNTLTASRIAITPLIATLPFSNSWSWRFVAWSLFAAAAITDFFDGRLARSRNEITDLGKMLDPLADKLLLVGTFIPMFWLMGSGLSASLSAQSRTPFVTPFGRVGLPFWIIAVVLGRELFMTVFRQAAARKGVVIASIGPAKWKTTFQLVWMGAAYFWFWIATLAAAKRWDGAGWRAFANFNGIAGTLTMAGAVLLTVYSLWLYLRRYGALFFGQVGNMTGAP